jgi:hypothetical protein
MDIPHHGLSLPVNRLGYKLIANDPTQGILIDLPITRVEGFTPLLVLQIIHVFNPL